MFLKYKDTERLKVKREETIYHGNTKLGFINAINPGPTVAFCMCPLHGEPSILQDQNLNISPFWKVCIS